MVGREQGRPGRTTAGHGFPAVMTLLRSGGHIQGGQMGSIAANRGLGLIELLIASALGLTLATGVIQIYATSSLAARDLEAGIRVQENGRLALHFLLQELRAAASPDCTAEQWLALTETSTGSVFQNIRGWEAADTAPGD